MDISTALTGIGLIILLAVVLEKFLDAIKIRVTEYIPDGIEHWFWPLLAALIGVGVAFGIAPLKFFELFGVTGVTWWMDKIFAGLAIGFGSSFLYDMLDTENRPGVN